MIRSGHAAYARVQFAGVVVAVVASVLAPTSRVHAQTPGDPVTARSGWVNLPGSGQLWGGLREGAQSLWLGPRHPAERTTLSGTNMRHPRGALRYGDMVVSRKQLVPAFPATSGGAPAGSRGRRRSIGRKVIGGVIGAVGGFFAGGFLGAAIEGDRCDCDDPGLQGFVIGAPVGAVTAGILGVKYF
jgi:hypothetical protein